MNSFENMRWKESENFKSIDFDFGERKPNLILKFELFIFNSFKFLCIKIRLTMILPHLFPKMVHDDHFDRFYDEKDCLSMED